MRDIEQREQMEADREERDDYQRECDQLPSEGR